MQKRTFNGASQATQTSSWSGTHGAKAAIVICPRDGTNRPLPISATASVVAAEPVGTVVMLCQDADLVAQLRQSLASLNILTQQYFSAQTILADRSPIGPACLVIEWDGLDVNGLGLYEQLRAKGWRMPTIVLVSNPEIRLVVQFMRAGAEDVLPKSCKPIDIVAAINGALSHSRRGWQHHFRDGDMQRRLDQLTPREVEVVKLVLAGLLNKEIADKLHLALVTVKVHRGSAMRKLGARSAAELARLTLATNNLNSSDDMDYRLERPLAQIGSICAD